MAEFVLVAGAWLGAWAWDEVVPGLRAAGHGARAVTLSGVAERAGEPVPPQRHVQDVLAATAGLSDVVLVGHSYSGVPVGQAAAHLGQRLRRVVFVDANVPVQGAPFAGESSPIRGRLVDGGWPPPPAAEFADQGLTDDQITRLLAGATPHPAASLLDPAVLPRPLTDLPATYVKCLLDWPEPDDDVKALLPNESWRLVTMDTGHWPMFSSPADLTTLLLTESNG